MKDPVSLLVIDDDPAIVRLLDELLKTSDDGPFLIHSASTLKEGLRLLADGVQAALVLLDLSLPDCSGVETIDRVRPEYPDVPIVVFSGLGDEQTIFEAMQRGAQDYIVKDRLDPKLLGMELRCAIDRFRLQCDQRRENLRVRREERLHSLSVMAGGIAHDFNNLLMAMIGNAELALEESGLTAVTREHLATIRDTGFRAAELCRQMLLYSGRGSPLLDCIDLSWLVGDMSQLIEVSISKKLKVVLDLTPSLPLVLADASQMREVILSLVTNAAEAIGDGEGTIRIVTSVRDYGVVSMAEAFSAQALPAGRYVTLEVVDTGCGMDAAEWEMVLDPFYSTKFPGRGMGLAAVTGIVRGHKGAVQITSKKGRGSTFAVLLPPLPAGIVPSKLAGGSPSEAVADLILVIDDETALRLIASRMVERMGLRALVATNGREGVELFRAKAPEIGAVLLDMAMPEMDGFETMAALRQIDPEVRVILCSGYPREEIIDRFKDRLPTAFIQKPYEMATLKQLLSGVLGRPMGAASA